MGQYNSENLVRDMNSLGITLTDGQLSQLMQYYEMLLEWNQKMNLTAITEFEDVMKKHFIDSASLIKAYDISKAVSVIDVGTGAGFPGLVLKIIFPDSHLILLDSLNKRIQFLNAVIGALRLKNVEAVHGRAEDYARQGKWREHFDLCVSRAVANLSTLSEYCLPFVKQNGYFIAYKSEKSSDEMEQAGKAISLLGGRLEKKVDFMLPDSDIGRVLYVIQKDRKTPVRYPRKAGLPGKEPL
ncbi:MAG: 16S rRNA (guanine(527)-N(7))-methyltransferase RsmG [Lachnospiraceae bacterium]|jgi:16S rRNA (guanine527-N7)-methyltransferase|nr:16S rRNA (guanine(527)-N(7))-methyltransferase RsmG [Lachnospiraceae bacterium]